MNFILSRFLFLIVKSLTCTYRYKYSGLDNIHEAAKLGPGGSFLLATWHQNLLGGIFAQKLKAFVLLISRSKDADPLVYACEKQGHIVVRGSSRSKDGRDKGGLTAKNEMVKVICEGNPGAVTIDGPVGPPKKVKLGILDMSRKTNSPIIPYTTVPKSHWALNSWDKFRIPKPFSKIIIIYGKPIVIPKDTRGEDMDRYRDDLAKALAQSEEQAEQILSDWQNQSKDNRF